MANPKPFRSKEPSRGRLLKDMGDGRYPTVGEVVVTATHGPEMYDGMGKRYVVQQVEWRLEISIEKDGKRVGWAVVPFDDLLRQMREGRE